MPAPKASRVRHMLPVEAAWVGALLEGEGSLRLSLNRKYGNSYPQLVVGVTDIETIATLFRLIGDGTIYYRAAGHQLRFPNAKPIWVWQLSNSPSVLALLPQVYPYLTSKRTNAELILKHYGKEPFWT